MSRSAGTWWRPTPGLQWQYQLTTPVKLDVDVPVYDIDAFENDAEVVAALHAAGRRVIAYVDVGAAEEYRPDYADFPPEVLGKKVRGWSDERWLDIRRLDVLGPIMARRFDMCRDKGFDAVEPDMVEAYTHRTGFPLTAEDQLTYNRFIADLAHERGLAVGLKNDLAQIPDLVDHFDFAVNEQCVEYEEWTALLPFVEAGKAVFHVEYELPVRRFSPVTAPLGFSSIRKNVDLDARRWAGA
ncbi:Glycoside-hydrolase family GH114 [Streptoalloteichus tenebrarius]|uniref:Glycoside-hydrolase family GH114 n=1 Tax=Streptoalloteichus tenebrarius (strain ATCC 17920 / DSM 40477 / JCM 4838 / CBS 697.72 / NBRC 16177 / NCIMB 11028 / NRRL B-12390 / A12253. 1 / ISP 5477) TaxID=1933 RepID=A0ABT1HLU2_STRSD|nr:endo alpha-1,4 polygalactosaminidase [Streptoalloteichus tenebrarius]MCP2256465.1 Glycoside-hydrolase family GH114 [Streptoalloteichus tenebrarius]